MDLGTLQPAQRARPCREQSVVDALQQSMVALTIDQSCDAVLEGFLKASTRELGCRFASLALLQPRGEHLVGRLIFSPGATESLRRAGVESPPADISYGLDATENLMVRVFREGAPGNTAQYYDLVRPYLGPEYAGAIQQILGIASIAVLPLLGIGRCLGVLAIASASWQPITEPVLAELELSTRLAAIVIENAQLREELRIRHHQVGLLLGATIEALEAERERICLEIHDGVTQTLTAASAHLQTLTSQPDLAIAVRPTILKTATLVRTAIREAREVIATLRPASLDTVGLVATLRSELEELRGQTGLLVNFDGDPVRFAKTIETTLYRIVHEAINNVIKHAHGSQMWVRVKQDHPSVVVEVQDDGIGFEPLGLERQPQPKAVGLLSMRKRTELVGGAFTLVSSPGRGTKVRVEIPLSADRK